MYSTDSKIRKAIVRMDPDCAICRAPATVACDCEAKGLEVAVKQAEERVMGSIYSEIRSWVRAQAQDYILEYFRLLTERRKTSHSAHLDHITAQAFYHYNAPPHPEHLAEAQAALKRGIDDDWQSSVQRYPEVLEYFFGLVYLTLPPDDDPAVKDPPLSALNGYRKPGRRPSAANGGAPAPAMITSASYHDREVAIDRRTPAQRNRRAPSFRSPAAGRHPYNAAQYF